MQATARFADLAEACRQAPPRVALVLGSGMGSVGQEITNPLRVPFGSIPGLPAASVHGHKGCLALGDWFGRRVLLFEGRLHHYEGHAWDIVTRPMRLAAELGARIVVLTNAAGGIRADLEPGNLMAIRDHLEWTRPACWRQQSTWTQLDSALEGWPGLRYSEAPETDVSGASRYLRSPGHPTAYAEHLLHALHTAAASLGESLPVGVYAQLTGPCYETPAEIRALQAWGADAVGMSTACEAAAAIAVGMECAAVTLITNKAAGLAPGKLSHEEVLATGRDGAARLARLLERFLGTLL